MHALRLGCTVSNMVQALTDAFSMVRVSLIPVSPLWIISCLIVRFSSCSGFCLSGITELSLLFLLPCLYFS